MDFSYHLLSYLILGLCCLFVVLLPHGNRATEYAYKAGFWALGLTVLLLLILFPKDAIIALAIAAWAVIGSISNELSNLRRTLKYVKDQMRGAEPVLSIPYNEVDWRRWFREIELRVREALRDESPTEMGGKISITPQQDKMTPARRRLIKWYLLAVLCVVLFVPWTDFRNHVLNFGYALLFFPPHEAAVVNYGKVFLELIAVTCIAGLILLIQGKRAPENPKPQES